jgi:hypothetical protein
VGGKKLLYVNLMGSAWAVFIQAMQKSAPKHAIISIEKKKFLFAMGFPSFDGLDVLRSIRAPGLTG